MELEPWMRGTLTELDPVRRAVVHALELAEEDVERWCGALDDQQIYARPHGLPPVAFHLRHMARSLDRLLTYAEGRVLDEGQLARLRTEMPPEARPAAAPHEERTAEEVWREFRDGLRAAKQRVGGFDARSYAEPRGIGRKQLPTTVAGLLIHCAEHTARHVGQAVTTAKLLGGKVGQE